MLMVFVCGPVSGRRALFGRGVACCGVAVAQRVNRSNDEHDGAER